MLDARMDEVYHARCEWLPGEARWQADEDRPKRPESVQPPQAGRWQAMPARPMATGWRQPPHTSIALLHRHGPCAWHLP